MSVFQFTKDDVMRGIELVVMALLGLVVLLFVVRPLVRRILTPGRPGARRTRRHPLRRGMRPPLTPQPPQATAGESVPSPSQPDLAR